VGPLPLRRARLGVRAISLFLAWDWDKWPADPVGELRRWQDRGIERVMVSLGAEDMPARMEQLAPLVG
jgi:hypothetical protein